MFFFIAIFVDFVEMFVRYYDVKFAAAMLAGQHVDMLQVAENTTRIAMLVLLRLSLCTFAAVAFLRWMYTSHRNLPALYAPPQLYSSGWAIGGWFLPVANLMIPYQVMQEIFRGSEPYGLRQTPTLRLGSPSGVVDLWWCGWITYNILGWTGALLLTAPNVAFSDPLEGLWVGAWMMVITCPVRIATAIFLLSIIFIVNDNQQKRYSQLRHLRQQGSW